VSAKPGRAVENLGPAANAPTGGHRLDIAEGSGLSETRTSTRLLTEDIGFERGQVRDLDERYGKLHDRSFAVEWRTQTTIRAKESTAQLLALLADSGFAWRDIARLVGVSLPAVKKWRRGDGVSGENRRRVASLIALCDVIEDHYSITELASWFEMPILDGINLTALDLYEANRADLIFRLASGHDDPERVATDFRLDWRTALTSEFETFKSADGELSIRLKGSESGA